MLKDEVKEKIDANCAASDPIVFTAGFHLLQKMLMPIINGEGKLSDLKFGSNPMSADKLLANILLATCSARLQGLAAGMHAMSCESCSKGTTPCPACMAIVEHQSQLEQIVEVHMLSAIYTTFKPHEVAAKVLEIFGSDGLGVATALMENPRELSTTVSEAFPKKGEC